MSLTGAPKKAISKISIMTKPIEKQKTAPESERDKLYKGFRVTASVSLSKVLKDKNVTPIYDELQEAIKKGSIKSKDLDKMLTAVDKLEKLQKTYTDGKSVKLIGSKIPYLFKTDENFLKGGKIDTLKKLREYLDLVPLYLKKVEAVAEAHLTGPNAAVGATMIKGIPGVKDLFPLTDAELKKVHKMDLKQAVRWLEQNNLRARELRKAVKDRVVTNANAFKWLRNRLGPFAAVKAIKALRKKHEAKQDKKRKSKADKELKKELG